ncbi:MAG TPA: 2-C-methyl-D-erythritol 2,4-cyclodiphosphate synthase [Acholeplasmataceae bacterium]|jgi:2-C-methyl-D-erythritol 2,4-cyclodiphosphate synthase|nr:2-C-methyl-D-erythritol 2,4-cyclodiphosphate synthase [Acholeplasmataceae bacterium]
MYRIGHSHDTHKLVPNRKLILGGVTIPYDYGLLGHSDADCVYHVVAEAIIGALGLGDIGTFFPDTDPKYKDIDSGEIVRKTYDMMIKAGYEVSNIDITIFIEKPNLKSYKNLIKENIAKLLCVDLNQVNIKATRGEGLGFIGRGEGISAEAVVLLKSKPKFKNL